jgi:predicted permease
MIWRRLKHLFLSRRRAEERDMQEELDALVQIAGERELGNLTLAAENARETWQWTSLDAVVADVRYAFRGLRKNPGFAAVAIATLAVGIGANTAIFSVVNSLFLRPLPVQDAYRLVVLAPRERGSSEFHDLSYPDYRDYRAHARAFSDMLGFAVGMDGIAVDQGPHQVLTSYVTGNYFSMLGVRPALGRLIEPAEAETPGAAPVLVLGYTCWQRQFNSDPGVIGKSARLNGHAVTIVGVAPEQFHGTFSLAETDAYLPAGMLAIEDSSFWTARGKGELRAIARLKPGMSLKQGRASLQVIARSLAEQYPETNKYTSMEAYPEWRARPQPDSAGSWPAMVGIFLTLAFIVLLVACVNLASILRARGNARESEMAVRSALGAARGRLVRQLLTENVLLAIVGGAAGILLSTWISMVLSSICTPIDLPMVQLDFRPDWRVFAYAFGVALLAGLMVGLGPMRSAWRSNLSIVLHEGGRALSGSRRRNRARNVLVVTQVAASMVLLIAAGLLVRSLEEAQRMNLGFDPHHVLNLRMDVHQIGYDEARGRNFYGELLARARALPGVESAAFVFSVPFFHDRFLSTVHIEGRPLSQGEAPSEVSYNVIDPALLQTLRIPILRGRGFNEADNETAPRVAIVSQAMAERLWPGQDPVGKRFRITKPANPLLEVVGVARNTKFVRPTPEAEPYFYVPLSQNYTAPMTLQVRSSRPAKALEREVLHEIRALAPDLPLYDVRTMEESLGGTMGFFLFRVGADLAAGLGILALFLTTVGVYGVISYAASQRTHEIGLRMALGATGQDILRMVLGQGLRLIGTGVLIGLGIALAVSRAVSSLLVGVSASDPMTYTSVAVLLGGFALVAGYMPARRATRVDVMVALRHE